jgi:hypothetical protein
MGIHRRSVDFKEDSLTIYDIGGGRVTLPTSIAPGTGAQPYGMFHTDVHCRRPDHAGTRSGKCAEQSAKTVDWNCRLVTHNQEGCQGPSYVIVLTCWKVCISHG